MKRRVALVVAFLVVAGGATAGVLAFTLRGGTSNDETAADLYAHQLQVGTFEHYVKGADPDDLDRSGSDTTTTVRFLGGDRYELVIQNMSGIGFINSFTWSAPDLRITAVSSASGGSCRLTGTNALTCEGFSIRPPKCTCKVGGKATVRFNARPLVRDPHASHGVQNGRLAVGDLTLVPYHIPSYQGFAQNVVDLPLCGKGEPSTKAHPCVHGS